ncbi:hypothetical protein JTB14_029439 [Gonioctena quinquepunctata]|nr:hypothetical protein JTB14_029439 [Gonioctena quinquepunctata]
MVKHSEAKYEHKPIQAFEPMFVPSPTFKPVKEKRFKVHKRPVTKKRQQFMKIVLKHPRVMRQSDDEPIHPDVVVTYDGKRVSGQSLTAKLSDRSSILDRRISKASAFLTARPQFGQFKGELPPLNIDFINKNAAHLRSNVGVLSRDLDTPALPAESGLPQGSTRLTRVGGFDGKRRKRAAHHTPEHTAQQEEEKSRNGTQKNSSASIELSMKVYFWIMVLPLFLKPLISF